jgi:hypothetical protein
MDSEYKQKKRLTKLLRALSKAETDSDCSFGTMLYLYRPGDVAMLVPVFPELRGFEIVSPQAGAQGKDYDIWQKHPQALVQSALDISGIREWLAP